MSGAMPPPNPWMPERDAQRLKVLGKLAEEAGELAAIVARCIIQGIDQAEPVTGKVNRVALEDEIADVLANAQHAREFFDLDGDRISQRAARKFAHISEWREMLADDPTAQARDEVREAWGALGLDPGDFADLAEGIKFRWGDPA